MLLLLGNNSTENQEWQGMARRSLDVPFQFTDLLSAIDEVTRGPNPGSV